MKIQKYGAKCQHAQCMPMTKELKEEFLNGHNEKRSMYATGQGAGIFYQRTASRMATLVSDMALRAAFLLQFDLIYCLQVWDDELEMIALQNSAKCKMEYDHCHRTKRFEFVGQNLYAIWGYPKFLSVEDAVRSSIEAWYDEHKLIAGVVCINEFGNAKCQSDKIRHFTQMIWDDASHIGCAVVKTASTYYITCNYSYGNMVNRPVYKVGRTGSKCISGLNLRYPGLCNEREFDPYPPHDEPPVAEWKRNGKRCGINANRKPELFQ